MRKSKFSPTVKTSAAEPKCEGLSFTEVVEKEYTFTLGQLRIATTHDQLMKEHRKRAMALTASLIRKHRWDLFGTFAGYRIITNGYGQFKHVELDTNRLTATQIFDKLERLIA